MNTLKEGKVSVTMKDALIRNNIAEQTMKTAMKSLQCVSNKEMAFLKNKQAFYQKRQEQLKKGLESRNCAAASPQSPNLSVGSLTGNSAESTSFHSITKLQTRPQSALSSPSIKISYHDEPGQTQIKLPPLTPNNGYLATGSPMRARSKSTSDISQDVAAFLKKPLVSDNAGGRHGRRTSTGEMYDNIYMSRKASQSLITPLSPSNTSRSAPSSPVLTRRQVSMPGTQLSNQRAGTARRGSAAQREPLADDNNESLEDSLNKLKFCRYLRNSERKLENYDQLPDEVKPGALIIGHTKAVF